MVKPKPKPKSKHFFKDNGLSLVFFGLFAACLAGQSLAGWLTYNNEQREHEEPGISYSGYLGNPHFWQAVGENWESEFLQMAAYVLLTVFLFQRGSSESKDPDKEEDVDKEPDPRHLPKDAPGPVRAGGFIHSLYRYSLTLAFVALFLVSFFLHALSGMGLYNAEELSHGQPAITLGRFLVSSEFWFESMQNWQSEFLAVFSMVVLSIFLRQKGSPESKPVAAAHSETGR
jgi:uncharacterized protein DUF6766